MTTAKLGAEAVQEVKGGVAFLRFPRFADPQVVPHAVTTRVGGVSRGPFEGSNLSFKVGDDPVRVAENRSLVSRSLGMDLRRVVWVDQVHGDRVLRWEGAPGGPGGGSLGQADAIITDRPGFPLLIQVADCMPILFYDPVHRAIGAAHAGWRGTVAHIGAKTLLAMGEAFGSRPEETRAVLGPAIGPCCYEVGGDVREEFAKVFPWGGEVLIPHSSGHWKLDLAEANTRQLLEMGMKADNLIRSGLCTIAYPGLFYSHRAEAGPGSSTGRFGALVMMADK